MTQRFALQWSLVLNAALVGVLAYYGINADSNSLIANALDNASDAVVYLISLLAISRGLKWKRAAARFSGVMLIVLGLGVLADTIWRYARGSEPIGVTMIILAAIAAVINLLCVMLLRRVREDDVNVRAAETFSWNDFVSNGGIFTAGILVMSTGQRWPDLVVGATVACVSLWGGKNIFRDANHDDQMC